MQEQPEKQTGESRYVDSSVFHAEYLATLKSKTPDYSKLRSMLATEESGLIGAKDNPARLYQGFLDSLWDMNDSAALTHEDIRRYLQLPMFSKAEMKMLEFTDKHFNELASLADGSKKAPAIGVEDMQVLQEYPRTKLDPRSGYVDDFADKAGVAGTMLGTGVEAAAYITNAPVTLGFSMYGSTALGVGLTLFGKPDVAMIAAPATMAAWGPIFGDLAGHYLGTKLAEPYWNLTQGRKINNLFNQIPSSIPTYAQFKAQQPNFIQESNV